MITQYSGNLNLTPLHLAGTKTSLWSTVIFQGPSWMAEHLRDLHDSGVQVSLPHDDPWGRMESKTACALH